MRSAVAAAARGEFGVMGVVNVTPDSFSDGGLYLDATTAIEHALEARARQGAVILDVGGESTRPGANPVPEPEELRRVVPVLEGLMAAGSGAQISIDTSKARSPRVAIAAGRDARQRRDGAARRSEDGRGDRRGGVDCCLMHMLGEPRTMQRDPRYDDVVAKSRRSSSGGWSSPSRAGSPSTRSCSTRGSDSARRPSTTSSCCDAWTRSSRWGVRSQSAPRASHFWAGSPPSRSKDRIAATIATNVLAYVRGARVFRVHDVAPIHDALAITAATVNRPWASTTPTSSTISTT